MWLSVDDDDDRSGRRLLVERAGSRVPFVVERYGVMFEGCRPATVYMGFAMDVVSCVVTSVVSAQVPTDRSMCTATLWLTAVIFFVFAAVTAVVRPFVSLHQNVALVGISSLQFVAAVLHYYAHERDDVGLSNYAMTCETAAASAALLWTVFEVLSLLMFVYDKLCEDDDRELEKHA